jgi:NAD(P)-dependent dehydrogenase (short-subunit alcohol dehydrogenase family)
MTSMLDGKVALITGGTSGIGEATAALFIAEGAKVVFTGRDEDKGRMLQEDWGKSALFVRADVKNEPEIKLSVDRTLEAFGQINILFNNAGGLAPGGVTDVAPEQFRHAMDLLVGSVVFGIRHAAPHMVARGHGRIINNASVSAFQGHMGQYLYSAAKAAVVQLTRMAGIELGRHGVTVNAISPGAIVTPVFFGGSERARTLGSEQAQAKIEKLSKNLIHATPLMRSGMPADIAQAALYLARDEGGFVNCHNLVVDGGMTAGGRVDYRLDR